MSYTPRILAFAGSYRRDSFNKKMVRIAAESAERAGAEVELIDLRDYPMPIYDADLEIAEGLPQNAKVVKRMFLAAQGLLLASPEYNSGITALMKNTIDWVSRKEGEEPALAAYQKKVAVLMAASPGALGGSRGLPQLRLILSNINVLVLPEQKFISQAHQAFDDAGMLKAEKDQQAVEKLGTRLVEVLKTINRVD